MGEGCGTYVGAEKRGTHTHTHTHTHAHRILIRKSEEKRPISRLWIGGRIIIKLH